MDELDGRRVTKSHPLTTLCFPVVPPSYLFTRAPTRSYSSNWAIIISSGKRDGGNFIHSRLLCFLSVFRLNVELSIIIHPLHPGIPQLHRTALRCGGRGAASLRRHTGHSKCLLCGRHTIRRFMPSRSSPCELPFICWEGCGRFRTF